MLKICIRDNKLESVYSEKIKYDDLSSVEWFAERLVIMLTDTIERAESARLKMIKLHKQKLSDFSLGEY